MTKCHHTHHSREWEPVFYQGRTWYPSREEAEYTALAFAMAVSASWWAVRTGRLPGGPVTSHPRVCRASGALAGDARAMREWAMAHERSRIVFFWSTAPLAISLELRPPCAAEAARLPRQAEFPATRPCQTITSTWGKASQPSAP